MHGRLASSLSSQVFEAAMQLAGHTNMSMTRRVYDRGVREVDPLE